MRTVCLAAFGVLALATLPGAGAQLTAIKPVLRPLPSGTGTIAGRVLTESGEPAGGATVSLKAQAYQSPDYEPLVYQSSETVADEFGRFTFSGVSDHTLELVASMPGFLETVYGQARPGLSGTPIRLDASQRLSVVMRLSRGSVIARTVFDSRGNPASGIQVHAFRMRPLGDGEALMGPGGDAVTDNRGEYRITDLPPGRYIVTGYRIWASYERAPVQRVGPNELAVESGAVFRDAADANSAEQLDISPGQERGGIDLRLRMDSVTTIAGVVRGADGQPAPKARVRLMRAGDPTWPVSETTAGLDGAFELARVIAGNYEIVASSPPREPHWGRMQVTSDGRTPTRVELDLRPAATVSGRVVLAGRSMPAPPIDRFTFFFARAILSGRHDVPDLVGAITSPTFTYRGVPPGHYVITVNRETLPAGWRMQSEIVGGRDALDFPFEVLSDEHHEVVITLSDQTTELAGTIADPRGAPSIDHTICIFASDDRYWTPRSRRIETVRPDTNGRYRVRGLPAGEYVVAVGDADVHGRPPSSVLRDLRAVSARVTLREGEKKTQDLRAGR